MIQTRHCKLCKFYKMNLKNGLTCGLTNKKPDFKTACSKIKFSNEFKGDYVQLLNNIEQIEQRRNSIYPSFSILIFIGLGIIIRSYFLLENTFKMTFNHSSWFYFKITFLIFSVGATFISVAFWILNKHRKPLRELKFEKRKIDDILKNYAVNYEAIIRP